MEKKKSHRDFCYYYSTWSICLLWKNLFNREHICKKSFGPNSPTFLTDEPSLNVLYVKKFSFYQIFMKHREVVVHLDNNNLAKFH